MKREEEYRTLKNMERSLCIKETIGRMTEGV